MNKILIPWPPDGTHTTIDFASLLRFSDTQGDHDTLGMYHLQTSLTRLATNARFIAFRHSSSPLTSGLSPSLRIGYEAHMTSLSNPGAGRWMYVVPSEPRFALTDTDYVCAIRTRLYLQGHTLPLTNCNCQPFDDAVGAYVDDVIAIVRSLIAIIWSSGPCPMPERQSSNTGNTTRSLKMLPVIPRLENIKRRVNLSRNNTKLRLYTFRYNLVSAKTIVLMEWLIQLEGAVNLLM